MANQKVTDKHATPGELLDVERVFTNTDIDSMIEAARLPADGPKWVAAMASRCSDLARRVEFAATTYVYDELWEGKPTPSVLVGELDAIAKAGRRFLAAMGAPVTAPEDTNDFVAGLTDDARFALQSQLVMFSKQHQSYPDVFPDLCPTEWHMPDKVDGNTYTDYQPGKALRRGVGIVYLLIEAAETAAADARKRVRTDRRTRNQAKTALRTFIYSLEKIYCGIFERDPGSSVIEGRAAGPEIRFIQAVFQPLHIKKSNDAVRDYLPRRRAKGKAGSKKI